MIHFQRQLTIDATPEEVWLVLGRYMHIDEFAPMVKSVDPMTTGDIGLGSQRRCHFDDGNSMVEEVVSWEPMKGYRVHLQETDPMPLKRGYAEITLRPEGSGRTRVVWGMDYQVKYGPLGWLLGQTMMKLMMGKVLDANLHGLASRIRDNQRLAA